MPNWERPDPPREGPPIAAVAGVVILLVVVVVALEALGFPFTAS